MTQLRVRLFGALRNCCEAGEVSIKVTGPISVQAVKSALLQELYQLDPSFQEAKLVHESALASATEILPDGRVIDLTSSPCSTLAILPPVCGG